MSAAQTCQRCGDPAPKPWRYSVAFTRPGEAAGAWCDVGTLCEPCAALARRAFFGAIDVAPAGGPVEVRS